MKTNNNGKQADNCKNQESNNRVNIQELPAGEYGDLCYDYFGKSSVIVFGNTSDHAAQLEAMGGKYSDRLRYSALQNGRKWTEKQGRTAGYYFTTDEQKREAIQYVQQVNHAIFNKLELTTAGGENLIQKPADFKPGDRVRTIHGLGIVTDHTPRYNAAQSVFVKLDKSTYNYGWKGMPQTFIECRCDEITRYTPSEKLKAAHERKAADIARERQEGPGTVHTSWATDFTADDFRKLTSRYEVAEEDRDIIGRRFELTGDHLGEVQIFVSDYAGNEAHALYYIWDEWMQEVRANVRPLSYLRDMLTEAKGWTRTA